MPRPKSKEELQRLRQDNFNKLNDCINPYSIEEKLTRFLPDTMNRNIWDVLAHLHHWHLMRLD
jgi:hypothetical protein